MYRKSNKSVIKLWIQIRSWILNMNRCKRLHSDGSAVIEIFQLTFHSSANNTCDLEKKWKLQAPTDPVHQHVYSVTQCLFALNYKHLCCLFAQ